MDAPKITIGYIDIFDSYSLYWFGSCPLLITYTYGLFDYELHHNL